MVVHDGTQNSRTSRGYHAAMVLHLGPALPST
jgi:hypothetical protein